MSIWLVQHTDEWFLLSCLTCHTILCTKDCLGDFKIKILKLTKLWLKITYLLKEEKLFLFIESSCKIAIIKKLN